MTTILIKKNVMVPMRDGVQLATDIYTLALELNDPGFDFSVLSEFRTRLLSGDPEERLLDLALRLFQKRKWLKAGGKQRTDSTHILSAVRDLNRLEIVGETLHHALNILAQVDRGWLKTQVTPEWFDRYGQRFSNYRLPKAKENRLALAETIGQDGHYLLSQVYAAAAPPHLRTIPAIDVLRQVWVQRFYVEGKKISWRDQNNFSPSSVMIASPYDLEVRYSQKRSTEWRGHKVHLTETCEADMPNLITHVETTLATDQDVTVLDEIHAGLQEKALLPADHLLDGAYLSGDNLVNSCNDYGIDLIGPVRRDKSWQANDEAAFDQAHFEVDWENQTATCPNGKQNRYWKPGRGPRGKATIQVQFDKQDCLACAVRPQCTHSQENPRQLTLPLQAQYLALESARQR